MGSLRALSFVQEIVQQDSCLSLCLLHKAEESEQEKRPRCCADEIFKTSGFKRGFGDCTDVCAESAAGEALKASAAAG